MSLYPRGTVRRSANAALVLTKLYPTIPTPRSASYYQHDALQNIALPAENHTLGHPTDSTQCLTSPLHYPIALSSAHTTHNFAYGSFRLIAGHFTQTIPDLALAHFAFISTSHGFIPPVLRST